MHPRCCRIEALPDGYQTVVSDSTGLSGGEKQRIAIARAMLKKAPIIVPDEATAYADAENEAKIQEAFSRLSKGKTVLTHASQAGRQCCRTRLSSTVATFPAGYHSPVPWDLGTLEPWNLGTLVCCCLENVSQKMKKTANITVSYHIAKTT